MKIIVNTNGTIKIEEDDKEGFEIHCKDAIFESHEASGKVLNMLGQPLTNIVLT